MAPSLADLFDGRSQLIVITSCRPDCEEGVQVMLGSGAANCYASRSTSTFAIWRCHGRFGGGPDDVYRPRKGWLPVGVVWMYLLMSAFHSAPWLKLIASRRSRAQQTGG